MPVTQARDSQSQGSDTETRYLLNKDLFDELMNAKGIPGPTARARKTKLPRSTYYRVYKREVAATLPTAMKFAKAAGTTVHKLFTQGAPGAAPSQPAPSPSPKPAPSSPPPPPGPKRGE